MTKKRGVRDYMIVSSDFIEFNNGIARIDVYELENGMLKGVMMVI